MAKLYFRYGCVGSAKTLNLLAVAHNYKMQDKKAYLIKPKIDIRFGSGIIKSRAGMEIEADLIVDESTDIIEQIDTESSCVLVDEVQFLGPRHIDRLREFVDVQRIPVICYGLRTDFKTHLFPGAARLLELADSIEEIKTTCAFCNTKGIFNLKVVDGQAVFEGESIELGCEEKYLPSCAGCYYQARGQSNPLTFPKDSFSGDRSSMS